MPPTWVSAPPPSQLPFSARALMSSLTPETRRSLRSRSLTHRTSAVSCTNHHAVFHTYHTYTQVNTSDANAITIYHLIIAAYSVWGFIWEPTSHTPHENNATAPTAVGFIKRDILHIIRLDKFAICLPGQICSIYPAMYNSVHPADARWKV